MKILVLGAGGRLGAALVRSYGCAGLTRAQFDLSAPEAELKRILDAQDFEVLINCAALTNVDYCETHTAEAHQVNAVMPGLIAKWCADRGARMVQIGTDYVFSGNGSKLLAETDEAKPLSVYGKAKLAGDLAVTSASPTHMAVRVSWIFGPDRPAFVDSILERALRQESVEAIGDKWASPTYTLDFASDLQPLLDNPDAGGVLHLCNSGATTWQEFGRYALQIAAENGWPLKTTTVRSIPIATMTNFVAARPVYSAMALKRYASLTGRSPRPWQEAVRDYIQSQPVPLISN